MWFLSDILPLLTTRVSGFFHFLADFATYARFRVRRHSALDFVSMGLGIRARHRRNVREWRPHLEHCKRFLVDTLREQAPGQSLAVLGAGRLYDFPLEEIAKRGWCIDLYDYDPALGRQWEKTRSEQWGLRDFYFEDLTGVMEKWSGELARLPHSSSLEAVVSCITNLPHRFPPQATVRAGYGCVVSLNILSQLGLYWRDRVETLLRRFQISSDNAGLFPAPVEVSLYNSIAALERGHLESLRASGAERVIIITDRSYLYYVDDSAHWDEHPALTTTPLLENYRTINQDSWFWHIAPRGREQRSYGEIHEVVAQSFLAETVCVMNDYPSAAREAAPVSAA